MKKKKPTPIPLRGIRFSQSPGCLHRISGTSVSSLFLCLQFESGCLLCRPFVQFASHYLFLSSLQFVDQHMWVSCGICEYCPVVSMLLRHFYVAELCHFYDVTVFLGGCLSYMLASGHSGSPQNLGPKIVLCVYAFSW